MSQIDPIGFSKAVASIAPKSVEKEAAIQTAAASPTPVTARLEISAHNICQYCKKKMRVSRAAGMFVFLCESDRNVYPIDNETLQYLDEHDGQLPPDPEQPVEIALEPEETRDPGTVQDVLRSLTDGINPSMFW